MRADLARLHGPAFRLPTARHRRRAPAAKAPERSPKRVQSRERRPERDELPSFGVFILAPVLGLGIWIALALLIFL